MQNNEESFAILQGDLLEDIKTGACYRILNIEGSIVTLCKIRTKSCCKLEVTKCSIADLSQMLFEKKIQKKEVQSHSVIDVQLLSEKTKQDFEAKQRIIDEAYQLYGPTWEGFIKRSHKEDLEKICQKHGISIKTARRWIQRFIESGFDKYSLLTQRNKGREATTYTFMKKPGRKTIEGYPDSGRLLTAQDFENFDRAINYYKKGPEKSQKKNDQYHTMKFYKAYDWMIQNLYIDLIETNNGYIAQSVQDPPSYRQFLYYFHKKVTKKEIDTIKSSEIEVNNTGRIQKGDTLRDSMGPMDIVEVDAWDAGFQLVSMHNPETNIGRPTVYAMIDTFSRLVVAVSVSLEKNSYIGITNLFMNLVTEPKKLLEDCGLSFSYIPMVSHFLPNTIRLDNGSEFISKDFDTICNLLNLHHQNVPAATGSMKGNVEQLWNRLDNAISLAMEKHGKVLKRHDDRSKEEACLNLKEFEALIYTCVIAFNQREMKGYLLRPDMLKYTDESGQKLKPRPDALWMYGIKHYLSPKRIKDEKQFLYNLMLKKTASYSKEGIKWKEIMYWPEDNDTLLLKKLYDSGVKWTKITVHIDPRCLDFIWYRERTGEMHVLKLNTCKAGMIDFQGMSLSEFGEYRKELNKTRKHAEAEARKNRASLDQYLQQQVNEYIETKERTSVSPKNLRENHRKEKDELRKKNALHSKLIEENEQETDLPEQTVTEGITTVSKDSLEEMLMQMWSS